MRQLNYLPIVCLIVLPIFSCDKQSVSPAGAGSDAGPVTSGETNSQLTVGNAASVSFLVNGNPLVVTGISYNRAETTTGALNFSAWNALQRVDIYCFSFFDVDGLSLQFSDSINYSTRQDSLTAWTTVRAVNWGTVTFTCSGSPLTDSVIPGEYSGSFTSGEPGLGKNPGDQPGLTVSGDFNLLFSASHPCH